MKEELKQAREECFSQKGRAMWYWEGINNSSVLIITLAFFTTLVATRDIGPALLAAGGVMVVIMFSSCIYLVVTLLKGH